MLEDLTSLRADFPDWVFHHHVPDAVDLSWEAKRMPFRYPLGGGVAWLRAGSAGRLRELLDAVTKVEAPC
ncbi:hypothetical protein E1281_16225 [Actinomadura sp. KC345]|uniref:hypothetical protein n=1 Tax=Actinomadura sp. KC345 TaxID=2530371 RepID=UPI00104CD707|nr:hypothetical protein [Actinomadura sp. KC345]TDC54464.1 hypothetical protein E1281_16225 [Actinomadura sp. KC345]